MDRQLQFSLRRFFATVTLMPSASACSAICLAATLPVVWLIAFELAVSRHLLGAGIFNPFRKPVLGALLGGNSQLQVCPGNHVLIRSTRTVTSRTAITAPVHRNARPAFANASPTYRADFARLFAPTKNRLNLSAEGKRMASGLTRNQMPGNRLRVRIPCPPLA